jgi:hypothetical protein
MEDRKMAELIFLSSIFLSAGLGGRNDNQGLSVCSALSLRFLKSRLK